MEEGSWIWRLFKAGIALKAQYGENKVFDLSLGNPVVEPPVRFHQEVRRLAIHDRRTGCGFSPTSLTRYRATHWCSSLDSDPGDYSPNRNSVAAVLPKIHSLSSSFLTTCSISSRRQLP